ncbi:MAG: hypothetical protein B7Z55_05220, partial [Planctomycetales bacterium 12-60-4]
MDSLRAVTVPSIQPLIAGCRVSSGKRCSLGLPGLQTHVRFLEFENFGCQPRKDHYACEVSILTQCTSDLQYERPADHALMCLPFEAIKA